MTYGALTQHIAEYNDLLNILNILKWDMRTQMPSGGASTRGHQLSTLNKLAKEKFTSNKTARLLETAESEVAQHDADSYEVRAVQQIRQYYEIQKRIPAEIIGAIAELEPKSEHAWVEARKNDDFASFAPFLQKMLDYNIQLAEAIGYDDHPYDALVFEYEPSMTAAKLRVLFGDLKAGLVPLLKKIVASDKPLAINLWEYEYDFNQQKLLHSKLLKNLAMTSTVGV